VDAFELRRISETEVGSHVDIGEEPMRRFDWRNLSIIFLAMGIVFLSMGIGLLRERVEANKKLVAEQEVKIEAARILIGGNVESINNNLGSIISINEILKQLCCLQEMESEEVETKKTMP